MDDVGVRLDRTKESFREKVKGMLDGFLREIAAMYEEFTQLAPYSHEGITTKMALAFINQGKSQVTNARYKVRHLSLPAWLLEAGRTACQYI